ncbi:AMP-binding protein [Chitinimonas naiadis]
MADLVALDQLLCADRLSSRPFATRHGQLLDHAAFVADAAAWYAAFAAEPGHRFALYFNDSASFAAALFGAWHAGKCVYLPADVLPATLSRLRHEVDGFAGDVPADVPRVVAAGAQPPAWQPLDRQAVALVVYTSGSTGEPSAIPKRLAQLFDEVTALAQCFDARMGDLTVLATVSHQHIYGLLFRVLWPMAAGRPFAAQRLAFPEDIAAALAQVGPCALVASPAHLKRLPDNLPWDAGRAALRVLFSSGGPLPQEALPDCRTLLGQAPVEVYGSSETGGIAWRQRTLDTALGWALLPGVEAQVRDDTLQVRSPHLVDAGWHATADRVRLTEAGFELLGRADRIVKIEEKRVSLSAMEAALRDSGLLQDARVVVQAGARSLLAVVGVPNEAGWALLEQSGKRALNQRLRTVLATVVETSVLPRHWRYIWALPVNPQGKTTEAALLALFDVRRPAARLLSHTEAQALLRVEVAASLPYFDGHFPVAPILPGVAQLEIALLFGRELFPVAPVFLRMEAIKFQQVITPGMAVELELGFNAEKQSLSFKFSSVAGQHASGRLVFGATQ